MPFLSILNVAAPVEFFFVCFSLISAHGWFSKLDDKSQPRKLGSILNFLIFLSDLLEPGLSFLFTKEFLVQSDLHQREDRLNLLCRKKPSEKRLRRSSNSD